MKVEKRNDKVYQIRGTDPEYGPFSYFQTFETQEAAQDYMEGLNDRRLLSIATSTVERFYFNNRQIKFVVVGQVEDPGVMAVRYVDDNSRVEDAAYESLVRDHYDYLSNRLYEEEFARGWDMAKEERERGD